MLRNLLKKRLSDPSVSNEAFGDQIDNASDKSQTIDIQSEDDNAIQSNKDNKVKALFRQSLIGKFINSNNTSDSEKENQISPAAESNNNVLLETKNVDPANIFPSPGCSINTYKPKFAMNVSHEDNIHILPSSNVSINTGIDSQNLSDVSFTKDEIEYPILNKELPPINNIDLQTKMAGKDNVSKLSSPVSMLTIKDGSGQLSPVIDDLLILSPTSVKEFKDNSSYLTSASPHHSHEETTGKVTPESIIISSTTSSSPNKISNAEKNHKSKDSSDTIVIPQSGRHSNIYANSAILQKQLESFGYKGNDASFSSTNDDSAYISESREILIRLPKKCEKTIPVTDKNFIEDSISEEIDLKSPEDSVTPNNMSIISKNIDAFSEKALNTSHSSPILPKDFMGSACETGLVERIIEYSSPDEDEEFLSSVELKDSPVTFSNNSLSEEENGIKEITEPIEQNIFKQKTEKFVTGMRNKFLKHKKPAPIRISSKPLDSENELINTENEEPVSGRKAISAKLVKNASHSVETPISSLKSYSTTKESILLSASQNALSSPSNSITEVPSNVPKRLLTVEKKSVIITPINPNSSKKDIQNRKESKEDSLDEKNKDESHKHRRIKSHLVIVEMANSSSEESTNNQNKRDASASTKSNVGCDTATFTDSINDNSDVDTNVSQTTSQINFKVSGGRSFNFNEFSEDGTNIISKNTLPDIVSRSHTVSGVYHFEDINAGVGPGVFARSRSSSPKLSLIKRKSTNLKSKLSPPLSSSYLKSYLVPEKEISTKKEILNDDFPKSAPLLTFEPISFEDFDIDYLNKILTSSLTTDLTENASIKSSSIDDKSTAKTENSITEPLPNLSQIFKNDSGSFNKDKNDASEISFKDSQELMRKSENDSKKKFNLKSLFNIPWRRSKANKYSDNTRTSEKTLTDLEINKALPDCINVVDTDWDKSVISDIFSCIDSANTSQGNIEYVGIKNADKENSETDKRISVILSDFVSMVSNKFRLDSNYEDDKNSMTNLSEGDQSHKTDDSLYKKVLVKRNTKSSMFNNNMDDDEEINKKFIDSSGLTLVNNQDVIEDLYESYNDLS